MSDRENNLDVKEDFSGFEEVSVRDNNQQSSNLPTQPPPKIDVSEAVSQAQTEERNSQQSQSQERFPNPDEEDLEEMENGVPQLPGASRGMFPPGMGMGMFPPGMVGNTQRPSFWKTLLNRGLIILAIVAVGVAAWWWWSRNGNGPSPSDAVEAAADGVRKTVVEPIKKALKLPPSL